MPVKQEEERLGASSLLVYLARILRFAKGQRRLLAILVLLSVVQAGLELSLPLLVRQGIDRYILSSYLRIDRPSAAELLTDDPARLIDAGDGRHLFVRRIDLTETERHSLEAKRLLDTEGWYRLPEGKTSAGHRVANAEHLPNVEYQGRFVSESTSRALPAEVGNTLRADDRQGVVRLAVLYLLLLVLNFGLNYGVTYGLNYLGQKAVLTMRGALWRRLLRLPVRYFDENPVGRLVTRATNDTANLSDLFSSVLASAVSDVVLFFGILTLLLVLDIGTTLWLLALAPPIILLAWWFKRASQAIYRVVRVQLARLNTFLQESVTGIQVVKAFVREQQFSRRFYELNQDFYRNQMRLVHVFAVFRPVIDTFATSAAAVVVWYAGGEALRQQLSVGTLVAFLLYLKMLFMPLQDLTEKFNILQNSIVSSERLFRILDTPEEPTGHEQVPGNHPLDIVFENVTFSYEPGQPVLSHLSFRVPAGGKVALVGPSGAGKTTIASLLLGFHPLPANRGRILVGGLDLERWEVSALRRRFSLVQQDLFLFSGSLRDNITLFDPPDADRLQQALQTSRVDRLAAHLPEGMGHQLNERGTVLSQGERQLVSFARALASGGQILILDEATSSVDSATEALIQAALLDLLQGRTALIIAHRLSTIQSADQILVLHHGRIVEQGNHAELLAQGGLYAQLHRIQLAGGN